MGFKHATTTGINKANSTTTNLGAVDAALKAKEAGRLMRASRPVPHGATFRAAESAGYGLPGSGALNHLGGALAAFGLGVDIGDVLDNGLTSENATSALTNGLGTGSWVASTLGASGGAAAGVAAPLMAAGAAGLTVGSYGNEVVERLGWLGESGEVGAGGKPKKKNWGDLAADWADKADTPARKFMAFSAGTSVGAIGAAGTAVVGAADALYKGEKAKFNAVGRAVGLWGCPLLDGVSAKVARARSAANDNGAD